MSVAWGHHETAIKKLQADYDRPHVQALLLTGSIAHGFCQEDSDVDFVMVVDDELYETKKREKTLTVYEDLSSIKPGLYSDGKVVNLAFLKYVSHSGNDATRFAYSDAKVLFDRTGQVADILTGIRTYPERDVADRLKRFYAQLEAWHWYCQEAFKKNDAYLLSHSVNQLVLFAGRIVLVTDRRFFPFHKWFMRQLATSPSCPDELPTLIEQLLASPTETDVERLYQLIKNRFCSAFVTENWPDQFSLDSELYWLAHSPTVDSI